MVVRSQLVRGAQERSPLIDVAASRIDRKALAYRLFHRFGRNHRLRCCQSRCCNPGRPVRPRSCCETGRPRRHALSDPPTGQPPAAPSPLTQHPFTPSPRHRLTARSSVSRPSEDCEGCPALAGVRNLGLDDPSPDRPVLHCNFGGALSALSIDTRFHASPTAICQVKYVVLHQMNRRHRQDSRSVVDACSAL